MDHVLSAAHLARHAVSVLWHNHRLDVHAPHMLSGRRCACRSVADCLRMSQRCLVQTAPTVTTAEDPNIAVFLPKTTLLSGLATACKRAAVAPLCLERNVLNGQLKALTLYVHAAASSAEAQQMEAQP
jgi:hypothetical protein